ncbi:MAG: hypothetical protein L0210_15905 [Rhodospirillales bacterium]|nr:hypothetical protein [Rhodospirillales bacterium]
MPSEGSDSLDGMSVAAYRRLAAGRDGWDPNPYQSHVSGDWHSQAFPKVAAGVHALLARYDAREIDERQLLRGKDNERRPGPGGRPRCEDTLSYWLYFQHHKGDERWKLLGQPYWSVPAWLSWRAQYSHTPPDRRLSRSDGRTALATFPKGGPDGLVSEHVVPKKVMKRLLLATRDREKIGALLKLNLCCVVTRAEDARLPRDDHLQPAEPWRRYHGKGIVLLHNPAWSDDEIQPLLRHGLLNERSIWPLGRRDPHEAPTIEPRR